MSGCHGGGKCCKDDKLENQLGTHILAEMRTNNHELLKDVKQIEAIMLASAEFAHCTVVQSCFHEFKPWGVSGAVVIAESHITIHTWPEHGFAAVDVFTCGGNADPKAALTYIRKALGCTEPVIIRTIARGF